MFLDFMSFAIANYGMIKQSNHYLKRINSFKAFSLGAINR